MTGPSLYDDPAEYTSPTLVRGRWWWLIEGVTLTAALVIVTVLAIVDALLRLAQKVRRG